MKETTGIGTIAKGLAHIGIFAKDIDASIDFYKRLGFSLDGEENIGIRLAFLSAGSCIIELVEQKNPETRIAGVVDHIAFEVDDIDDAIRRANAAGIAVNTAEIASLSILGGVKNVFFTGPDGERLEFFARFSK